MHVELLANIFQKQVNQTHAQTVNWRRKKSEYALANKCTHPRRNRRNNCFESGGNKNRTRPAFLHRRLIGTVPFVMKLDLKLNFTFKCRPTPTIPRLLSAIRLIGLTVRRQFFLGRLWMWAWKYRRNSEREEKTNFQFLDPKNSPNKFLGLYVFVCPAWRWLQLPNLTMIQFYLFQSLCLLFQYNHFPLIIILPGWLFPILLCCAPVLLWLLCPLSGLGGSLFEHFRENRFFPPLVFAFFDKKLSLI